MKNNKDRIKGYTTMIRLNKDIYQMAKELREKNNINISSLMRNAIKDCYDNIKINKENKI
jgi:predicted DNA-binding ribbon-helix-helix protein